MNTFNLGLGSGFYGGFYIYSFLQATCLPPDVVLEGILQVNETFCSTTDFVVQDLRWSKLFLQGLLSILHCTDTFLSPQGASSDLHSSTQS